MEILEIFLLICVIVLSFKLGRLKIRIQAIEDRLSPDTSAEQSNTTIAEQTTPDSQQSATWSPPETDDKVGLKRLIATPAENTDQQASENPQMFVFQRDLMKSAISWVTQNWFYALAAISLALAGIFMIQYSVEAGLLSPPLRVVGALILGGALIFVAEYLRRKGSDEKGDLAYLPSTFAAGGFITLFAAIWGAYSLYGLIDTLLAFALLALIGFGAILCGWIYGPLVSAIGTIGAIATPFLLGGESENTHYLMPYFAAVTAGSLLIDSLKRWAWLSTLALGSGIGATIVIYLTTEARPTFLITMIGFVLLATIVPSRSLLPKHSGPSLLPSISNTVLDAEQKLWPDFPPRLVLATLVASCGAVFLAFSPDVTVFWLCLLAIGVLLLITLIWMANAPGLEDTPIVPGTTLFAFAALVSPLIQTEIWRVGALGEETLANDIITPVLSLGAIALVVSAVSGWRSFRTTDYPVSWSVAAVIFAPMMAILLDYMWQPVTQLGRLSWALCLLSVAALMTWFTGQYSKRDGEERLRTSLALSSAIVMISFAIVTVLSESALTIALALTTAITAFIATRQKLPLLAHLVSLGAIIVSVRLITGFGLFWSSNDPPLWELCFAFITSIALLLAARRFLSMLGSSTDLVLHSTSWSLGGVFATQLLYRAFQQFGVRSDHLEIGLFASVWLILAFAQFYSLQGGKWMKRVRLGLGWIYITLSTALLTFALTWANPLFEGPVLGPPLFNSLLVAYGVPAGLLGAMAYRLTTLRVLTRRIFGVVSGALALFTVGVLIRHIWRRPDISVPNMEPGELYSYTVAMMIGAGTLLIVALRRKSPMLRRAAFVALGVTAAKVFLIDASGLTGLIRVFAFLALGLTLAGLAWLNRRFGDDGFLTPEPGPDIEKRGDTYDKKNAG